jgi:hypothetical protein
MHVIVANIKKRSSFNFYILASILFIILIIPFSPLIAQTSDTNKINKSDTSKSEISSDTSKIKAKVHSPKKAMLMSACLPGLGQAYNKKYWKIPIIYGGAAAITYFAIKNLDSLNIYTRLYKKYANIKSTSPDSLSNFLTQKTDYKRYTDLTFIFAGVLYALNIIDATVDAYMFTYDLSDDLSMHVLPTFYSSRNYSYTGLSFSFTFGKQLKHPPIHKEY